MARSIEDRLAEIEAARAEADSKAARASLRAALRSTSGVVIAAAAKVVHDCELDDLQAELAPAFVRLTERPLKRDPGCRGKTAIARVLYDVDRWEDDVFCTGVQWIQLEPVWGGREDSAAELRGICAFAYAANGHPDVLVVLAELLADRQRSARAAAARALGNAGRADAAALLRYKVLVGDEDAEVLTGCFASLLALDAEGSLPFVKRFLTAGDERREQAAVLALGESRTNGARALLTDWCDDQPLGDNLHVGYLALALLRDDAANDYLIALIAHAHPSAIEAVRALATFRDNPALAERVRQAAKRAGAEVQDEVERCFG